MVRRLSWILLRIALAVPLVYGLFLLGRLERRATVQHGTFFRPAIAGYVVPTLGLLIGCALLLVMSRPKWAWMVFAATGLYIIFIWYLAIHLGLLRGIRGPTWRQDAEAVVVAYNVILASALLLVCRDRIAASAARGSS
jgi:hypothetical protein